MKALLTALVILLATTCPAQTRTYLLAGAGASTLSPRLDNFRVAGAAGLSVENQVEPGVLFCYGLSYRQRGGQVRPADGATSTPLLHYVQTDFAVKIRIAGPVSAGVGGFYALEAGSSYGDDAGALAFVDYEITRRWSLRLAVDRGLNDALEDPASRVRNLAGYLLAGYRIGR